MKRIVITGASRGIGRAIAVKLAQPEHSLIIHGRDREALETTSQQVRKRGAQVESIYADLSKTDEITKMTAQIRTMSVDCVINNAGMAVVKPLGEISLEEWQQTFAVNVTAPFLLIQQLLPSIPRGGAIVNILSIAARSGYPNWSSYCMSKFALEGFTQSIREELRSLGIRVINIYPAATASDIWNTIPGEWAQEKMMSPDEVADAVVYALSRPASVMVDTIVLGNTAGML